MHISSGSSSFFSPLDRAVPAPSPAPLADSGMGHLKVDLLVVGASFAGLACARAAALAGLSVMVLEKKASAGAKLHTTGIIVKDAVDSVPWLAEVPPALVRRIEGVRLYAPNMRHVDLHAPGYWFWATDAPALLDWMVDSARSCGVDVRLGTLFEQALWVDGRWEVPVTHGPCITATYLVGADGPHSRVAKALGLSRNTRFLYGVEHEYQGARMAPGLLHCFVDRQLAPGYIGWALEGVGVSQIGLARRMGRNDAGALKLEPLLRKIAPVVAPGDAPPVAVRAGMIPCGGVLPRVARERALLVGDAAGMVSPGDGGRHPYRAVARPARGRGGGELRAPRNRRPRHVVRAQLPGFSPQERAALGLRPFPERLDVQPPAGHAAVAADGGARLLPPQGDRAARGPGAAAGMKRLD
jgi:digeranylgeranylglycerophospholipid reductase